MHRHQSQRGAALILLLGIIATLAILSATLVFVIVNQQRATANVRSKKQSFYAAEAALDSGVRLAKVDKMMSTTAEWLTPEDLAAAFAGVGFPADAVVTYRVYDNLATVDYSIKWDRGGPTSPTTPDQRVWVEATVAYHGQTTRSRVLVQQTRKPFAEALPKAVTYSDTGIMLNGTSDIYAVNGDGTAVTTGYPYVTSITAGGTWTNTAPPPGITASNWAEVGRLTMNSSADLAAPGSSTQSLGITVNGSVKVGPNVFNSAPTNSISSGGRTFDGVVIQPGVVGYLSDYFDQAAQASLMEESMEGKTPATAPGAPSSWTSSGFTSINSTLRSTLESTSSTTTYNATSDLFMPSSLNGGRLTLSRGTNTTGRTFNFRRLYVSGDLTLTGPVTVNCTDLYVGGRLIINNATTTTVNQTFGPLYVNGTGASSVAGRVNVVSSPTYVRGSLSVTNTTNTPTTAGFGALYCVGALNISGNVESSGSSLYGGNDITFTGHSSGIKTHTYPLVYANSYTNTTLLSGNVQLYSRETTLNGAFTISGATNTNVKNWLGHLHVYARPTSGTGKVDWSGTASVTSRDYLDPDADPKPMWMGMLWTRTGIYHDEYGNVWVPGNSGLSIDFNSTGPSTVLCPLLSTTERTEFRGNVTFGTREKPMVYFFMCDNNGIYPQVFKLGTSSSSSGQYTGTYFGLMVINESTMEVNGIANKASVEGAVFAGCPYDPSVTTTMSPSDIVLNGASSIAYNKEIVGAIATSTLKTTILVTETVPGSWQQLPGT